MLVRPRDKVLSSAKVLTSCTQFPWGYLVKCPWTPGTKPDEWARFASHRREEQSTYPRLVFRNHEALVDQTMERLVHRALEIRPKTSDAATTKVTVIGPLREHRAF